MRPDEAYPFFELPFGVFSGTVGKLEVGMAGIPLCLCLGLAF